MKQQKARILLYDIEVSYTVGAVWGLYEQNVLHVLRNPYILTVAWKWLGEKTTHVISLPDFPLYKKEKRNDRDLVKYMWKLFDEADVIIAHNGNAFDQKWTYGRFLVHGMVPPSPSQYVDTKLVAKAKFRFNSNKLDDLGIYLGVGRKIHTDKDLWVDCIENDLSSAWAKMCKYNKQDVVLLEKVYNKMKPFITNHPNLNLLNGTTCSCSVCGSTNLQKRGYHITRTAKKQRFQCQDCGHWELGKAESVKQLLIR